MSLDFNDIPEKYNYDDTFLYCITRLEKLDLIEQSKGYKFNGQIPVGWTTQWQSEHTQIPYKREIEISITDFGKKYIKWVLL